MSSAENWRSSGLIGSDSSRPCNAASRIELRGDDGSGAVVVLMVRRIGVIVSSELSDAAPSLRVEPTRLNVLKSVADGGDGGRLRPVIVCTFINEADDMLLTGG